MKSRNSFVRFWLPVYLYAALIFFISSIPKPLPDSIEVPFLDKFLHAAEYGVLGYLIAKALGNSARRFSHLSFHFLAVTIAVLYGTTDEIHQAFVPNRMASGWDVLFDGIGAVIGAYVFKGSESSRMDNLHRRLSSGFRRDNNK